MDTEKVFKPVVTRAAQALEQQNKTSKFTGLVFEEPKYTPTSRAQVSTAFHDENDTDEHSGRINKNIKKDNLEFDIKKAHQEVLNFAISNQRNIKNKRKMEIFKLVKLGAKPPKKAYKNYKELLDERKRLKNIREERKKFHQLGKNQTGAASVKCRNKTKIEKQMKKRAPVTRIDAYYGVANPKLKKKK